MGHVALEARQRDVTLFAGGISPVSAVFRGSAGYRTESDAVVNFDVSVATILR